MRFRYTLHKHIHTIIASSSFRKHFKGRDPGLIKLMSSMVSELI